MSIPTPGASPKTSLLACNGCTSCCRNDAIVLHPECGDDISNYQTIEIVHPLTGEPAFMLDHKPNGECVYLTENGCGIYEDRPVICREYDCRKQYMTLTKAMRQMFVEKGLSTQANFDAGKKRLGTLSSAERLECIAVRKSRVA